MRYFLGCVFGSLSFFSLCLPLQAAPMNLGLEKQQLINYHDTGKYAQDITAVAKQADFYLRFRINQNQNISAPHKLAMVLAVDETALSNYQNLHSIDFGGTNEQRLALEAKANDPAINNILNLYNIAQNNDVSVFFISNRPESLRQATLRNLKRVGFHDVTNLYLRKANDTRTITAYKTSIRKMITNQGYDIAVNIGDQYSDLDGGYADMAFKLANPFYLNA